MPNTIANVSTIASILFGVSRREVLRWFVVLM
jgi:hypothetical protein